MSIHQLRARQNPRPLTTKYGPSPTPPKPPKKAKKWVGMAEKWTETAENPTISTPIPKAEPQPNGRKWQEMVGL